jgi:hypothetical protein
MKSSTGFVWYVCVAFHLCFCLIVIMGAAFLSGELRSFQGLLPGLTKLVKVTHLIMLQRQRYCQKVLSFYCLIMCQIHSQIIMSFC